MRYISKADPKELKGVAILRLDFNTEDEWRMEATIPTIKFLLKTSNKVVILSHRGRPEGTKIENGKLVEYDKKLSLRRDYLALQKLLKKKIIFIQHFDLKKIKDLIDVSCPGSVILLENIRFLKGEEENSSELGEELASLGDLYVNDAFAVSHRANASLCAITKYLPSFAGLELEKEIENLSKAIKHPDKPLVLVLGGAKPKDKLGVIKFLKNKAESLLIGGASATPLLKIKGVDVGTSFIAADEADMGELKKVSKYKNLLLPAGAVCEKGAIMDIDKETVKTYSYKIKNARTIIWSGPLGYIEKEKFSSGSLSIARAIVANKHAFSIVGGGETVMFLKEHKLDKKISFVSTGGGAMLDFLAGERLPGIEALKK